MDQIYNDFTTKLLPKIQEGLVITKDYFLDLFSRYIKFLFIVDVMSAILLFLGAVGLFFFVRKSLKEVRRGDEDVWIFGLVLGTIALFTCLGFSIESTVNAIKDKYIPEIRVLEKIQSFKDKY